MLYKFFFFMKKSIFFMKIFSCEKIDFWEFFFRNSNSEYDAEFKNGVIVHFWSVVKDFPKLKCSG